MIFRDFWPILLFLALFAARPASAQLVQTRDSAMLQDAKAYAGTYAVPIDEAVRRLRIQQDSVGQIDAIAMRHAERLAGISLQHRPDFRFIVYLTGDRPVPPRMLTVAGTRVPVTFRTGAQATRERILWALTNHQPAIRAATGSRPSMGVDPRSGELVVIVGTAAARAVGGAEALDLKLEQLTGVPVQVRALDRVDRNLSPLGGGRLEGVDPTSGRRYRCTSGFLVTDGARTGITTAAHCPDALTYLDPQRQPSELGFVGQWGWGYHDVQVHSFRAPDRPLFHADTQRHSARPVQARLGKASTRVGDFVCHRGESTGYSCAEVELLDFAPAGELCGGYCLPTWVAVAGPNCKGGDSGGPVFLGTTAIGMVKGATYRPDGSCAFYFYMSLDYLPSPWSLIVEPGR